MSTAVQPSPDSRPGLTGLTLGGRVVWFARRVAAVITVGIYMINAPFGYVILAGLSFLWRRDSTLRARRLQRVSAAAFRLMHDWLRWFRITDFNHRGALAGLPDEPCVIVANHPTLMDITSISAVRGGGCTIAKPAMHRRRMLHPLMVGAGHIEGPGPDPMSARRVVDHAVERLQAGFSVIVFPEGTRSPRGELLPFGRIAFEIACRAGVPLASVGITCDPVYLSKDVHVLAPPHPTAKLRLGLLAVDDPAEVGGDSRALLERVEGRFAAWFAERRLATQAEGPYIPRGKDAECPISSKTA